MPNWCINTLEVASNQRKELWTFAMSARGEAGVLSLESLRPVPPEVPRLEDEWLSMEEYDWRREHWGTKALRAPRLVNANDRRLRYAFDTAWTPPLAWIGHASQLFPDATFYLRYIDIVIPFKGIAIAWRGDLHELCHKACDEPNLNIPDIFKWLNLD